MQITKIIKEEDILGGVEGKNILTNDEFLKRLNTFFVNNRDKVDFLIGDEAKEKGEYLSELISSLKNHLEQERKNLRKNQISSFEKLIKFLESGKVEGLIKQPTGAGKTRLFGEILKATGKTSLILVPRTTLVGDTKKEFVGDKSKDIDGFGFDENKVYTIDSTNDSSFKGDSINQFTRILENIQNGDVVITTYQSFVAAMKKNPNLVSEFIKKLDVVVSDEAHRSTGDKTKESISKISDIDIAENKIEENFKKMHLRFTATPQLLEKNVQGTYNIDIIDWLTLKEVVDDGTLIFPQYINPGVATYKTEEDDLNITNKELEKLAESGRFVMENGNSVEQELTQTYLELKEKHNGYLPAVAFCSTIKQAEDYKNYLQSLGIRAQRATSSNKDYDMGVSSDTAKQMFHDEELDVIVTVSKVGEGWDVPTLRASIWLTPRNSPADKIQGVGRTMRKLSENSHHPKKDSSNTYLIEPTFKISKNKVNQNDSETQKQAKNDSDRKENLDIPLYESKSFFEMLLESGEYDLESLKGMMSEEEYEKLLEKIKEEKEESPQKIEKKKLEELNKLSDIELKNLLLQQNININNFYEKNNLKIIWKNLVGAVKIDDVYIHFNKLNGIIKNRISQKEIEKYSIFFGNGAKVKSMGGIAYFIWGIDYIFDYLDGENIESDKYFLELIDLDYQKLVEKLSQIINIQNLYLYNFVDRELELEGHKIRMDRLYNLLISKRNNDENISLNQKFSNERLKELGIENYKDWANKITLVIAYLIFGQEKLDKFYKDRPRKEEVKKDIEFSLNIPQKALIKFKEKIVDYENLFDEFGNLLNLRDLYKKYGIYFMKNQTNNIDLSSIYRNVKSNISLTFIEIDLEGRAENVPGNISDIIVKKISKEIWGQNFINFNKIISEKRIVFEKAINENLDYENKEELKMIFGTLDELIGNGEGKNLHLKKIKTGNKSITLGQVWFQMRKQLNLEEYPKELSEKTARFLAEYIYGTKASEQIQKYKEKRQQEIEEFRKQQKLEQQESELDDNFDEENLEETDNSSEDEEKKKFYNNLPEEYRKYLSIDDISEIDKKWLIAYRDLHIVKIKYLVGELGEDIIDYDTSELKDFQQMTLKEIKDEFE